MWVKAAPEGGSPRIVLGFPSEQKFKCCYSQNRSHEREINHYFLQEVQKRTEALVSLEGGTLAYLEGTQRLPRKGCCQAHGAGSEEGKGFQTLKESWRGGKGALYRVLGLLLLRGGLRRVAGPAHFRRNRPMSRWRTGTVLGNPKYWEAGQSPASETIAAKRRKHGDPKAPTHVSERSDQQPSRLLLPRDGVTRIAESRPQSLSGRTGGSADRTFLRGRKYFAGPAGLQLFQYSTCSGSEGRLPAKSLRWLSH